MSDEEICDRSFYLFEILTEDIHETLNDFLNNEPEIVDELVRERLQEQFRFWKRVNK